MTSEIILKDKVKIFAMGNSLGLTIPKVMMEEIGLENGDEVWISLEKGKNGKFIALWETETKKK